MKCALCSRIIQNIYTLNNKNYGYNCYKLELEKIKMMKLMELEKIQNSKLEFKNLSLITIYKNKKFKDSYNSDFQKSVIEFYNKTNILTRKQFDIIISKLNDNEKLEFNLLNLEFTNYKDNKFLNSAFDLVSKNIININDMRIAQLYKHYKEIEKTFYLVKYKEDGYIITRSCTNLNELKEDQEDGYISNLEYVEYNF